MTRRCFGQWRRRVRDAGLLVALVFLSSGPAQAQVDLYGSLDATSAQSGRQRNDR